MSSWTPCLCPSRVLELSSKDQKFQHHTLPFCALSFWGVSWLRKHYWIKIKVAITRVAGRFETVGGTKVRGVQGPPGKNQFKVAQTPFFNSYAESLANGLREWPSKTYTSHAKSCILAEQWNNVKILSPKTKRHYHQWGEVNTYQQSKERETYSSGA